MKQLFFSAYTRHGHATIEVKGPGSDVSRLGQDIEDVLADLGATRLDSILDLSDADYTVEARR